MDNARRRAESGHSAKRGAWLAPYPSGGQTMRPQTMCSLGSLAAFALLFGCDQGSRQAPTAPAPLAALAEEQDDGPPRFSDWSTPVNLGPIVNSPASDFNPSTSR